MQQQKKPPYARRQQKSPHRTKKLFNDPILTQNPLGVNNDAIATDRLLAAIDAHRLHEAVTILESLGYHDPETQIRLLAACQRREVCDA